MNSYLKWKMNNPLYGKQVSVLSDASGALEGYLPQGYPHCIAKSEMRYMQTWFGQVIDFFGAVLLSDSSMANSSLYSQAGKPAYMPSIASGSRIENLKKEGFSPDLILIYHDYFSGFYEGFDESRTKAMVYETYMRMLECVQKMYPKAALLVLLPEEYGDSNQKAAVLAMQQACLECHAASVQVKDGISDTDTLFLQQNRIAKAVIAALDSQAEIFLEEDPLEKAGVQTEALPAAPAALTASNPEAENGYKIMLTDSGKASEQEAKDLNMSALLRHYLNFETQESLKEESIKIHL